MPGGDGVVSWVSAEDIAAVAAAALAEPGHEGKGYTLVGLEPLTMAEVAAHISAAAGRRITYVESGRDEIRELLVANGMPPQLADPISELYVYSLTSGVLGVLNDDVATVTGRPPVSFAEFAAGAAGLWRR